MTTQTVNFQGSESQRAGDEWVIEYRVDGITFVPDEWACQWRTHPSADEVIVTAEITTPELGVLLIRVPGTVTQALAPPTGTGRYFYDVEHTAAEYTPIAGAINVISDVTRVTP